MADPEQALTIRDIDIGGKNVAAGAIVWVHGRAGAYAEVEYRSRHGKIPLDAIVPYPVHGPPLEELRKLDPCFGLPDEAFETEHLSAEHYYEIRRCRAHGRRFLCDTRGSIAWYSMTTLLADDEQDPPDDLWARHHWKSPDLLLLEGRTL